MSLRITSKRRRMLYNGNILTGSEDVYYHSSDSSASEFTEEDNVADNMDATKHEFNFSQNLNADPHGAKISPVYIEPYELEMRRSVKGYKPSFDCYYDGGKRILSDEELHSNIK